MKLLGILSFGLAVATGFAADPIPDTQKINGFALGCQAYSFNRFSVFEAIEKTAYAGGKVIEFFNEDIERLQHEIAARHGYVIEDHSLVLYVRPKKGR